MEGFIPKSSLTPYPFPKLAFFPKMPLSESNPVTKEGAELGRYLFYDAILSGDKTMACATCHKQEAAFSDAPTIFSEGNHKTLTKRNTMPLFNLAWYPTLFWDGRATSIEEQVFHPVRDKNEMNLSWEMAEKRIQASAFYRLKFQTVFGENSIDSVHIAKAIGQFLRTLLSYQSKYDQVLAGKTRFTEDEKEGFALMNDMTKGDCLHCHTTDADALGTTRKFSNNGLDKTTKIEDYKDAGLGSITKNPKDYGKFKIPSLRNVALTAPYMHDGRFKNLAEVLDFYSEKVNYSLNIDSKMGSAKHKGVHLTAEEKCQIIAFLHTLTDSVFIREKDFGNPFWNRK